MDLEAEVQKIGSATTRIEKAIATLGTVVAELGASNAETNAIVAALARRLDRTAPRKPNGEPARRSPTNKPRGFGRSAIRPARPTSSPSPKSRIVSERF